MAHLLGPEGHKLHGVAQRQLGQSVVACPPPARPAAMNTATPRREENQLQRQPQRTHLHGCKILVAHPHDEQGQGQPRGVDQSRQSILHIHDASISEDQQHKVAQVRRGLGCELQGGGIWEGARHG